MTTILTSLLDESRNFITPHPSGLIEARYVRRSEDYFIVYLSSQSGCAQGCRFCHLTQTAQTNAVDLTLDEIFAQADEVLDFYDALNAPATEVHFNFMARGEPLVNHYILADGDRLVAGLYARAAARRLVPSVKFSTILPASIFKPDGPRLVDVFPTTAPDIYFSLYSLDPAFRRRWLPRACDPRFGLELLADWQRTARKIPVLHWAFIAGENDQEASIAAVCDAVLDAGLRVDVNIVRYNPYSDAQGKEPEPEVVQARVEQLAAALPGARIKVVTRVGFDVAASCGMFVGGRRPVIEFEIEP